MAAANNMSHKECKILAYIYIYRYRYKCKPCKCVYQHTYNCPKCILVYGCGSAWVAGTVFAK